jgi:Flp pilus assembly protein TadD
VLGLIAAATLPGQTRYHAKIVSEDGTAPPQQPQIIPSQSQRLMQNCWILNTFGNGTVEYAVNWRSRPFDPSTMDACEVTIRAEGFKPMVATLREQGTVVLKRAGDHEGSTISRTAIEAPPEARKAYEKGVADLARKKWAAAQKEFQHAVDVYPDYAPAWTDLGDALLQESQPQQARDAWEHARKVDPKYMRPYLQLARLDLQEKHPQDAAQVTDEGLKVNSREFPGLWFINAVANFNLGHLDVAENGARKTIDLDSAHEIPRAEDLLGSILAVKGDRAGAIQHLRKYLEIAPHAGDADKVQQRIDALQASAANQD